MSTSFKRVIEHFICLHCGASVEGDGYTNHCPACLWSRHVDMSPGDRASNCKGMMEPVLVMASRDGWILTHRCVVCGHEKKNRSADSDDREALVSLARSIADGITGGSRQGTH